MQTHSQQHPGTTDVTVPVGQPPSPCATQPRSRARLQELEGHCSLPRLLCLRSRLPIPRPSGSRQLEAALRALIAARPFNEPLSSEVTLLAALPSAENLPLYRYC